MAKIRKFSVGQGISSITAFHGFKVNSEGELIYTKSTDDVDIVDPNKASSFFYQVRVGTDTVGGASHGNFYINGVEKPEITYDRGRSFIFDQSHYTNAQFGASAHPIQFSKQADGELAGFTDYTLGVTYILDGVVVSEADYISNFASATSRRIQVEVLADTPDQLYYYCANHTGMGNSIVVADDEPNELYDMYEISGAGVNYAIDADGELVAEIPTD
jgi:hypothetical protein